MHKYKKDRLQICVGVCEKIVSQLSLVHVAVEDLERNDGSQERPYFMSQDLLTLLKKSNEDYKSMD